MSISCELRVVTQLAWKLISAMNYHDEVHHPGDRVETHIWPCNSSISTPPVGAVSAPKAVTAVSSRYVNENRMVTFSTAIEGRLEIYSRDGESSPPSEDCFGLGVLCVLSLECKNQFISRIHGRILFSLADIVLKGNQAPKKSFLSAKEARETPSESSINTRQLQELPEDRESPMEILSADINPRAFSREPARSKRMSCIQAGPHGSIRGYSAPCASHGLTTPFPPCMTINSAPLSAGELA